MKKDKLLELIKFAFAVVEDDDSFQGRISWDAVGKEDFLVDAAIRHGNKEGQGFMVLVQEDEVA